jgi:hypothetical protein
VSPRIFCYDTEFLDDGKTIELISIGIVCDDRREYYAVNADMPVERIVGDRWLKENVWPQLPIEWNGDHPTVYLDRRSSLVKPKWVIANEVRDFITGCIEEGDTPQLWADYAAYDHVVLAQLFGPMIQLPEGIPMFTHDLRQLRGQVSGAWKEPKQTDGVHNALEDARHNMRLYRAMTDELAA